MRGLKRWRRPVSHPLNKCRNRPLHNWRNLMWSRPRARIPAARCNGSVAAAPTPSPAGSVKNAGNRAKRFSEKPVNKAGITHTPIRSVACRTAVANRWSRRSGTSWRPASSTTFPPCAYTPTQKQMLPRDRSAPSPILMARTYFSTPQASGQTRHTG